MAVPVPDIQLVITPPGGSPANYTGYLQYTDGQQEMTITQQFGRQGDTAVMPLAVEHAGSLPFAVPPGSQIRLDDYTAGQTLFGGMVTNPSLAVLGPALAEWDLNCTDWTFLANSALVRFPSSSVQASDQIVVDITNSANCGISAARIADGGFVAPGPSLPDWTSGYVTLTSAWKTLASAMGTVIPFGWYVDDQRRLHFYDQDTALDSGVTFTTSPTTAGSLTEGHILKDSEFLYEWDITSLANRIMVQGATQSIAYSLAGNPTDQWLGDGFTTQWPLRYTVSSGSSPSSYSTAVTDATASTSQPVVLFVGGSYQVVTVESSGSVPSGAWSIISNSNGGYFLVAASPPPPGAQIQIWYTYSAPIIARATDTASVAQFPGPNNGIYAMFVSDSSLTTVPMALARAQQQRAEYAFPVERVTFNTSPEFLGWVRAGYTFTFDCALVPDSERGYAMGVNDQFLVTANTVTFGDGGYRTCQITAIRT